MIVSFPGSAAPPMPTPTIVPAAFEYRDSGTDAVAICTLAVFDPPAASVAVTDIVSVLSAANARHEPLVMPLGDVDVLAMLFAPLTDAPTDAEYVIYTYVPPGSSTVLEFVAVRYARSVTFGTLYAYTVFAAVLTVVDAPRLSVTVAVSVML